MPAERAEPRPDELVWFELPAGRPGAEPRWAPPVENLYRLIGTRWVVAVLRELDDRPVRYNLLQRRLAGVSKKMLTQTLRRLERANLVSRHSYPTVPPNVDYRLTRPGRELLSHLTGLDRWASSNGMDV